MSRHKGTRSALGPTGKTALLVAVVASAATAACYAPYDQNGTAGSDPSAPTNGSGAAPYSTSTDAPADVGAVTLHRLNAAEYDNTIRDLLGDSSHPSAAFPPDDGANSFTNNADALSISPVLFEQYDAAAEKLATGAIGNKTIMTCDGSGSADACAKQILTPFLRRAWRRPVTAAEVTPLAALVQVAAQESQPFSQGMQLAFKAALLSPSFLFRVELDPDPKSTAPHALSDFELASRLSYFLWSSMPDDELLALADAGKLTKSPQALDEQVARMIADPKAHALIDNFASQWLTHTLEGAKPDATMFPSFDEGLRTAMSQETKAFVSSFIFGDQALPDLLDAEFTYVNGRLATYYGLPGVTGTDFVRVPVTPASHRGGLLTQASILTMTSIATRTSPVRRGEWVLSDLLCSPPPPPPPSVPPLPAVVTTGTMRQKMDEHAKNPACAGCHVEMDPIGYAFEHYDAIGRWRDTDQSQPIDATGKLPDGRTFDGEASLAKVIKEDPRFMQCATQKFFTYALGRDTQMTDDTRLKNLTKSFGDDQFRTKALIAGIIHNEAFRMRRGGT